MKTTLPILAVLLLFGGCATKRVTFNGLICPAGHNDSMIKDDLRECRYYDMEAIEKASEPKKFDKECLQCLIGKGYEVE